MYFVFVENTDLAATETVGVVNTQSVLGSLSEAIQKIRLFFSAPSQLARSSLL